MSATMAGVDLITDDFFEDPYPTYQRLRDRAPLAETRQGGFLLTRHADIAAALKSPELVNTPSRYSVVHPEHRRPTIVNEVCGNILPYLDGEKHSSYRQVLLTHMSKFYRRCMSFAVQHAPILCERYSGKTVDLIHEIGQQFTLNVMCHGLGFPQGDCDRLNRWAESFFFLFAPMSSADVLAQTNHALAEFRNYVEVASGSSPDRDAFLRPYLNDVVEAGGTEAAAFDNVMLLFADGIENLRYAIGSIYAQLSSNDALSELNPNELRSAVNEALRLETPAQIITRIVKVPTIIHGRELAPEQPMFLALGSANRDGDAFCSPDIFQLDRNRRDVFTFGAGRHACLGGRLASDLLVTFLTELLQHAPKPRCALPNIPYRHRFGHRWLTAMPVKLGR